MQFFNYDEITVWRQSGDYTVYNTESHTGLTAQVDWDRGLLVVQWQQGTDCWLLGESCTRWEGRHTKSKNSVFDHLYTVEA